MSRKSKLPVYLRACFDQCLQNRRVKDAVAGMKSDIEVLEQLNKELVPEDLTAQDQESAAGNFESINDVAAPAESHAATGWPQIPLLSVMRQPQGTACWPAGLGPPIVAGTTVGLVMAPEAPLPRNKRPGFRGADSKPQAKRWCQRCVKKKGREAETCNNRNGIMDQRPVSILTFKTR
jgi:hypothetical protein